MYFKKNSIFVFFYLCTQNLMAQVVGDSLQITLKDQSIVTGKLLDKKGEDWLVGTKSVGNISLKKQNVVHFEVLKTGKGAFFKQFTPPHYWAAHTAIPLEKGEGHYQTGQLIFHSANYGFTKYFSVSAGLEILSFVNNGFFRGRTGESNLPVFAYVSPRLSYTVLPNWHVSGGILMGRDEDGNLFNGLNNLFNVLFATTTLGNRNHNLSFTYGHRLEKMVKSIRFSSTFPMTQDMNFIGLAGKVRFAEKWAILGESWSWTSASSPARTRFLSIGVRYSARRWNLGMGILTPFFEGTRDESIPLVTLGIPFQLL